MTFRDTNNILLDKITNDMEVHVKYGGHNSPIL